MTSEISRKYYQAKSFLSKAPHWEQCDFLKNWNFAFYFNKYCVLGLTYSPADCYNATFLKDILYRQLEKIINACETFSVLLAAHK